ncbi:MAG: glucosyl-3-phosphoglycerate synthase [Actinobacteria bacterium]|nr:glucosyl-3-phosphoglycerate synthase [Actinomycetota bacterium]
MLQPGASYDHHEFTASGFTASALAASKAAQSTRISVCLPARDEAETVGPIVAAIRRALVERVGLVDEIVVVDDESSDATANVAAAAGARVVRAADVLADCGPGSGKGNVLWKSLYACDGDLLCWVDADIRDFSPHFVTGLLGPLLTRPDTVFVKGFYRRPGERDGGGRVTELVARPLLSQLFPHLTGFVQPLSGEYAGRREVLDDLPFVEGWGVELALLVDVVARYGLPAVTQVDLGERRHRNRPLAELGPQATEILLTALRRAGLADRDATARDLVRYDTDHALERVPIEVRERPPMRTVAAYRAKFPGELSA